MDEDTKRALEESIQHWRENAVADDVALIYANSDGCALCALFLMNNSNGLCHDCPVNLNTGQPLCNNSPWSTAYNSFLAWRRNPESEDLKREFHADAQVEADYLETLRG